MASNYNEDPAVAIAHKDLTELKQAFENGQLFDGNPGWAHDVLQNALQVLERYKNPAPGVWGTYADLNTLKKYIEEGEIYRAPKTILDSVGRAIDLLKQGEPFNPEPHPESGQGKWRDTAAMFSRNQDFYQGIINQIGAIIGPEAFTSDDGSVQDSVLALKLPELVKGLKEMADKNRVM